MPSLTLKTPDGSSRTVALVKRITTLGRGGDNDVRVEDPSVPDVALHFVVEGQTLQVGAQDDAELHVNGKRRTEHALSDGDVVKVGNTEIVFSAREDAARPGEEPATDPDAHTRELD